MIKSFEEQTKEVTDKEKPVVAIIVSLISEAKDYDHRINSLHIIQRLSERQIAISDSRIRKIIQHIRKKHTLRGLCADSGGYWLSTDPKEIRNYAYESYGSRIREMQKVYDELMKDAEYFEFSPK